MSDPTEPAPAKPAKPANVQVRNALIWAAIIFGVLVVAQYAGILDKVLVWLDGVGSWGDLPDVK